MGGRWPFRPRDVLEFAKPVTWFPPIWAYACGAVSSGQPLAETWPRLLIGMVLAGPLVCGTSQMINDWCDRHVDALNEPHRVIPSGRIPGRWGYRLAWMGVVVSLAVATLLGPVGVVATAVALLLGWMYSAPPFRLKTNGWWGNLACGASYEGLAWVTGAGVALGGAVPPAESLLLAALFSLGAHGIMTLNDFKATEGDIQSGVGSLPVRLGPARAARVACATMLGAQLLALAALAWWGLAPYVAAYGLLIAMQVPLMRTLLRDPRGRAPWYNQTGVTLYVLGMLLAAFGLAGLA
jgi:chlorophyll synthase